MGIRSSRAGIVLFFICCFTCVDFVNAQLEIDADIRPRFEYRHGFGNLFPDNAEPGAFVQQRTRLNFNYTVDKLKFGISVQDVSVWGDTPQIAATDANDSFSLFQAWVSYQLDEKWSTKFGRQVLSYDDQRILGGLDWAQQGRSHDAALVRYVKGTFKTDLGFAFNQQNVQSEGNGFFIQNAFSYKSMQFAHVHKDWASFNASFLFLNTGFQKTTEVMGETVEDGVRYVQTTGIFAQKPINNTQLRGSFYYQFGEAPTDVDINAYQFMVEADYKPSKTLYGIGVEVLSGTDQAGDSENKSFFPLYGTNHKFNGYMDYFYVGNHANNVGLNDVYAKVVFQTSEKSNLRVKGHYFSANADLLNNDDKYLGTEVDLVYTVKPVKNVVINVGYSHMFASDSMSLIKGGRPSDNTNNWGWVRLMFRPKIFSTNTNQTK